MSHASIPRPHGTPRAIMVGARLLAALASSQLLAVGGGASPPAGPAGEQLDAREFGAAGDGVHDDAPALQKAVNAAQSSGRTLRIPAGVYLVNSTVVVAPDEPLKKGSPACSASTPAPRRRGGRRAGRRGGGAPAVECGQPLRLVGDGMYNTVLLAGRPMAAVLLLPNITQFNHFSHFGAPPTHPTTPPPQDGVVPGANSFP